MNPIIIRKRIDKATPLLIKCLVENTVVSGGIRFFRPNPAGDGTTEQFYTIQFSQARITEIRQLLPDVLDAKTAALPPMEEISITFRTISWTYTNGGVTHEDTIKAVR